MRKSSWLAALAFTAATSVIAANARTGDQHVTTPPAKKRPPTARPKAAKPPAPVQRPSSAAPKQQQPQPAQPPGTKPKPAPPPISPSKPQSRSAPTTFLTSLPAVPTPKGTLATVRLPAHIDPTGATDVSDQLNAFFAALPNQRVVVFGVGATYRIEKPLVLKDKVDLVIQGNGARTITTTRGDRTRQHWRLYRGERIAIRNLTVVGANPNGGTEENAYVAALEAQHGFNVAGTRALELDRVTVTDVFGDFVYLGWDSSSKRWSEDVRIHNSVFARNGRQAIAFTGARRIRIDHNRISQVRRATFDLEPNGGATGVEKVLIEDNMIGVGRLNFVSAVGAGPVNYVTVRNNVLRGRSMNSTIGSFTDRRRAWAIVGNTADEAYGAPSGAVIGVRELDDLLVTRNTQPVQPGRSMHLVSTSDVCAVSVTRNTVRNASGQVKANHACTVERPVY